MPPRAPHINAKVRIRRKIARCIGILAVTVAEEWFALLVSIARNLCAETNPN